VLDRLNRIARRLLPLRMLFLGLAIFGFLMLIASLFIEESREQGLYAMPALTLFLWALSLYVFILNFAVIPERLTGESSRIRQGWQLLQRAWCWLVALFFLAISLVLLYVTARLIMLWIRDFF
jgi:hypothetical protein